MKDGSCKSDASWLIGEFHLPFDEQGRLNEIHLLINIIYKMLY